MTPQPRPALRRADDAGLHPALAVAPSQEPPPPFSTRSDGAERDAGGSSDRKRKGAKAKDATTSGKRRPGPARPLRSAGHATSDALRAGGDKLVALDVRVPKATRKQLRAVAKQSGTTVEALVTAALNDWLGDPRRW